jgi:3-deoxy-manno-octulosonate cytidylyltransferase (CMP-KDO synthetase)
VATDHEAIVAAVRAFGGEVVMTSPDCPSGTDRIAEAARTLGLTNEIIINVQGDEPLIEPDVITAVIEVLRKDPTRQVATAVTSLTKPGDLMSPNVVKAVLAADGAALYFSRSAIPFNRDRAKTPELWTESGVYHKHLGIYGYRMAALERFVALGESMLEQMERLEQLRFLEAGVPIYAAHVDHDSVAVDTKEDIRAVELLIAEKGLA